MVIDMIEVRDNVVSYLADSTKAFQDVTLGQVGIGLIAVGCVLAVHALYKDWKKKKGYRMALRERSTKLDEILSQVINDGLFEAEVAGKISQKEMNALYAEISKKLDLPDLVPKQRRCKIVKEEIKARLVKSGKLDVSQWKRTTFSDTVGKFKFW
jgi:hypothetical protein